MKFTKKDLKVGYLVKAGNCLHMLMESESQGFVLVDKDGGWLFLASYDDDFNYIHAGSLDFTITEIYGLARFANDSLQLSTKGRELLWKRGETETANDTQARMRMFIVGGRQNGKTNLQVQMYKHLLNSLYGSHADESLQIENVIFNDPATIVFWKDGTKTVVKATNEDFDPEKGLAMAISKKALGNKHDYYNVFKKWMKKWKKSKDIEEALAFADTLGHPEKFASAATNALKRLNAALAGKPAKED